MNPRAGCSNLIRIGREEKRKKRVNVRHPGKDSILGHLLDDACPFLARSKKASAERKNHSSPFLGWSYFLLPADGAGEPGTMRAARGTSAWWR